jgi:hypothetical protein
VIFTLWLRNRVATNLDRAQIVSKNVQLSGISLKSAKVLSDVDPCGPPEELELNQSYRARFELSDDYPDKLFVYVELRLSAARGDGGVNVVDLEGTYRLVYDLKVAVGYPADSLRHFAELNGAYNVWPYWRELVQTVTGRVGIPSVVIPVFRPPVRQLTDDEEQQLRMQLEGNIAESSTLLGAQTD